MKITLKDIINGQKRNKTTSYNTDLFNSDSENITDTFNKSDYDFLYLLSTDTDNRTGLLKETIIGIINNDAFLINTSPNQYNGEVTVSIFSKWLTLQGFNYFTKKELENIGNDFVDDDGHIELWLKEFYTKTLQNKNIDISYQDIIELGEYNPEYKCITLSAIIEELNQSIHLTINERQQLSKITIKSLDKQQTKEDKKPVHKSILS